MKLVKSCVWLAVLAPLMCAAAQGQITRRASLGSSGGQGNHDSRFPAISADSLCVAFESNASNLVAGDANAAHDVFVHDRQNGATGLVSVDSSGAQGDDSSSYPSISADGRYVAFESFATNLVVGDTNDRVDIFIRDRQTGTTVRVSVDSAGAQANDSSQSSSISDDARYVAFYGYASNLVPGDTNGSPDVFVHDRQTGATSRVSVSSSGVQGNNGSSIPFISADGRYVVFESTASNLVSGDTNGSGDIFIHDRQTAATSRVSVSTTGVQANSISSTPSTSADGRYVMFYGYASNLVSGDTNGRADVFVHDRQTGVTSRLSVDSSGTQGNHHSYAGSMSAVGRHVAFFSEASNLVAGDTNGIHDVFVHDRQTGVTSRASVDSSGAQADSYSVEASISADGLFVAFNSAATTLVPGDTNARFDVFVRDRNPLQCPAVALYCLSKVSSQGCLPALSTTGVCSASAGSGFLVQADAIEPNKNGLFFYSTAGPASTAFQGGLLCVLPPTQRTSIQNSGGSAACSGTYVFDLNAHIYAGFDPTLTAGVQLWGQYWYRDPQSPSTTGLTHAVTLVICQ